MAMARLSSTIYSNTQYCIVGCLHDALLFSNALNCKLAGNTFIQTSIVIILIIYYLISCIIAHFNELHGLFPFYLHFFHTFIKDSCIYTHVL